MKHHRNGGSQQQQQQQGSDHLAKSQRMVAIVNWKTDPQTREPVHRAITITMEAYAMVGHDAKTNKGCELAMDGMHMLVSKQYFSGRAGGKDDSSGSGSKAAAAARRMVRNCLRRP
jgi:hypothetical protein